MAPAKTSHRQYETRTFCRKLFAITCDLSRGHEGPRHRPHCATHGRVPTIDSAGCITVTVELPSPRVFRPSLDICVHHAEARCTSVRRRRQKSPAHSRKEWLIQ